MINAQAQCTDIMREAIQLASDNCAATGRNQACHGYYRVQVEQQPNAPVFSFEVGDVANMQDIRALTTSPLNEATGDWGVALLRLQVNLPDTLPGENVTFLVLGDTTLVDQSAQAGLHPMQVFRLDSNISGVSCAQAPSDGLIIQSPEGEQQVRLGINGVTVEATGTAFVQATAGQMMSVTALEGDVQVTVGEQTRQLNMGTSILVPMSDELLPMGAMSEPQIVVVNDIPPLPTALLPRPITIYNPVFMPPGLILPTLDTSQQASTGVEQPANGEINLDTSYSELVVQRDSLDTNLLVPSATQSDPVPLQLAAVPTDTAPWQATIAMSETRVAAATIAANETLAPTSTPAQVSLMNVTTRTASQGKVDMSLVEAYLGQLLKISLTLLELLLIATAIILCVRFTYSLIRGKNGD